MMRRGVKRNRRGDYTNREPNMPGPRERQTEEVDENSPIIKLFRQCQSDLDDKHNKYERLVKLSRDVTIDSKRIIFLLHRTSSGGDNEPVLDEAITKLTELQQSKWVAIARELDGEDPYHYLRAYSPGLQEYIEAVSFYHYLKDNSLVGLQEIEAGLTFTDLPCLPQDKEPASTAKKSDPPAADDATPPDPNRAEPEGCPSCKTLSVHVPPMEYMLGLADLTGELMRISIRCAGTGNIATILRHCHFMRDIYEGFISFGTTSRVLSRKLTVLKQSLEKVETACYTLQVRGSEIPKHMLVDMLSSAGKGDSGGYREEEHFGAQD